MLVVSQRPLDLGGGGSVRWRHLQRVLPRHGWRVVECAPPAGATTQDTSTDPRAASLAARRAQLMESRKPRARPFRTRSARSAGSACAQQRLGRHRPPAHPLRRSSGSVRASSWRRLLRRARFWPPRRWSTASRSIAELRDLWAGNPYFDRGSPILSRLQGHALAHAAGGRHGHRRLPLPTCFDCIRRSGNVSRYCPTASTPRCSSAARSATGQAGSRRR